MGIDKIVALIIFTAANLRSGSYLPGLDETFDSLFHLNYRIVGTDWI